MPRSLIVFALVFFAVSSGSASAGKRVALAIGNGAYMNVVELPNPPRDATAIAELFKKAGFEVVEAKDLTQLGFKRALQDFEDLAEDAEIAVVFYAGHAIELSGENYMIPVDAKLEKEKVVEDETVSLVRIFKAVEPANRLSLVILDACRENPFLRKMQPRVATRQIVSKGLALVTPTNRNTLIAYAAKSGSVAKDGDGEHSPFTTALLKHLIEPGLDIRLAMGRVRDDVLTLTRNEQEPFVYSALGGKEIPLLPVQEGGMAPVVPDSGAMPDIKSEFERLRKRFEDRERADQERAKQQQALRDAEAKRKAEQEQALKAAEAKRKAEQEQALKEAEAKRKAEQEKALRDAEAKRKAEQEQALKAAEAKRKAEQEQALKAAEAKRKAEQEQALKAAEAKRKAEQEQALRDAEAKRKAEQEQALRDAEAKRKAEQEQAKKEASPVAPAPVEGAPAAPTPGETVTGVTRSSPSATEAAAATASPTPPTPGETVTGVTPGTLTPPSPPATEAAGATATSAVPTPSEAVSGGTPPSPPKTEAAVTSPTPAAPTPGETANGGTPPSPPATEAAVATASPTAPSPSETASGATPSSRPAVEAPAAAFSVAPTPVETVTGVTPPTPTTDTKPDGQVKMAIQTPSPSPDEAMQRSKPPSDERRAGLIKDVQKALSLCECYSGAINGDASEAAKALSRLEEQKPYRRTIELASANIGEFDDLLVWLGSDALKDLRCPAATPTEAEQEPEKKSRDQKNRRENARPQKPERNVRPEPQRARPSPSRKESAPKPRSAPVSQRQRPAPQQPSSGRSAQDMLKGAR